MEVPAAGGSGGGHFASGWSREASHHVPTHPASSTAPVCARDPDSGGQCHRLGAARQSLK